MSINCRLVLERLDRLGSYADQLEDLKALPRGALDDPKLFAQAESFLRRALEAVFDVGRHILAKSGHLDLATEYKSIAQGLVGAGVISDTHLATQLPLMAGYRNRLVHFYFEVKPSEMETILERNLADLRQFQRDVRAYLNAHA